VVQGAGPEIKPQYGKKKKKKQHVNNFIKTKLRFFIFSLTEVSIMSQNN
jgi:hypothetical protein